MRNDLSIVFYRFIIELVTLFRSELTCPQLRNPSCVYMGAISISATIWMLIYIGLSCVIPPFYWLLSSVSGGVEN